MGQARDTIRCRLKYCSIALQFTAHQGFTLMELLMVVVIVGALAAIAAPSWLAMLNAQRLTAGQDRVHQVIRQAQTEANRRSGDWEAGFREVGGVVQVAAFSAGTLPNNAAWQPLETGIRIDTAETTLSQTNGVYRVQFDSKGQVSGQLGALTLQLSTGGTMKRCVYVSTLLGTLRKASNQSTADSDGKYCY